MDRREELAQAVTHLERGERLVAAQRALVGRLSTSEAGLPLAQDLLKALELSLDSFRHHLRLIRSEIDADEAGAQR